MIGIPKPVKLTKEEKLQKKFDDLKTKQKERIEKIRTTAQKRVKKAKEPSTRSLLKKAQILVNRFVRIRDKDEPCISCRSFNRKSWEAGHFWTQGEHGSLRFDLSNLNKQCDSCNRFKSGNLNEYRLHLIKKVGREEVDRLDSQAHNIKKWTKEELYQIIESYTQLTKDA